ESLEFSVHSTVWDMNTAVSTAIKDPPLPVWVTHTPPPDNITNNGEDDTDSTGRTSSSPPYAEKENDKKGSLKNRLKSLIPQSWGRKWTKESDSEASTTGIQILPNGTRVSPPVSPLVERRNLAESLGGSSQSSHKPLLRESPSGDLFGQDPVEESLLSSIHPAEYYAEKVEVYKQKYSYLKSWPGLLRLLAGLQLLFGGMVFACVIAYIQKDSEWSNSYGLYNGIYNNGMGLSGYSYRGSFLVCLKMWRHEAARRERQYFENQLSPASLAQGHKMCYHYCIHKHAKNQCYHAFFVCSKYPEISCVEERDKYKAVFNDQYQEYKDLHKDISATLSKFRELDAMMKRLPREQHRIQRLLKKYQEKRNDPAFLEKQERYDYLKAKLSHIKNRIRVVLMKWDL
uniref:MARVEL domain containing 2-like n=1 Tax=Amphilophus citrinellus TaxID=61819 RepID=A0A3Q0ST71_AMPCI